MKNIYKLLVFCFLLSGSFYSFSQTSEKGCKTTSTLISGTYQGKNLYFQTTVPNSIQTITINNKPSVSKFQATAFELDLSGLKKGETYEIKISFCESKEIPYKLLNPEAEK